MLNKDRIHIRIVSPGSRDFSAAFDSHRHDIENLELSLSYHKLSPDPSWPFTAGSRQSRLDQLCDALTDPLVDCVLGLRGGFGTSDLLDHIPWKEFQQQKPKLIIGFSDISALHSAFYSKLKWHGLHAPMPATEYWGQNGTADILALKELVLGRQDRIQLPLTYLSQGLAPDTEGPSFGGCLAVLSNLIGTPYFPESLEGHIIFWEDIGEHPGRILRMINQWQQSGALKGINGLILGSFLGCEVKGLCTEEQLCQAIADQLEFPVWHCPAFGHCSPNWPLPVGLKVSVFDECLQWSPVPCLIKS